MNITKIVLYNDEGTDFTIDVDGAEWEQHAGICRVSKPGEYGVTLEGNGQMIMSLKAWKGCARYEAFQANTERSEPFVHGVLY